MCHWGSVAGLNGLVAEVNGAVGGRHGGLTLTTASGEALGFRLGPPKKDKPIRFAVGQPGHRSTTWRLWANPQKSDVYLASRRTAGIFKVGLHESGDWRQQWIKQDPAAARWDAGEGGEPSGRVMLQWERPAPLACGWTAALSIWVPSEDVSDIPGDSEVGLDTQWVECPSTGSAVAFEIFLVEPRRGGFDMELDEPNASLSYVNGFRLAGGEAVLLFARTLELSQDQRRGLRATRRQLAAKSLPDFDMSASSGPRAAVWEGDDPYRHIWDISLLSTSS